MDRKSLVDDFSTPSLRDVPHTPAGVRSFQHANRHPGLIHRTLENPLQSFSLETFDRPRRRVSDGPPPCPRQTREEGSDVDPAVRESRGVHGGVKDVTNPFGTFKRVCGSYSERSLYEHRPQTRGPCRTTTRTSARPTSDRSTLLSNLGHGPKFEETPDTKTPEPLPKHGDTGQRSEYFFPLLFSWVQGPTDIVIIPPHGSRPDRVSFTRSRSQGR